MKKVVLLNVQETDRSTLSYLFIFQGRKKIFESVAIQPPFIRNEIGKSRMYAGDFILKLEWSSRFNMDLWEVYGIHGRKEIKFHAMNYARQSNGCIGPGRYFYDIDKDGLTDVTQSKDTLDLFHKALEPDEKAILKVIDICY